MLLFLCQLGLTPVLIYNVRTTRFEQEVFFLVPGGTITLPCLLTGLRSRVGQGVCWLFVGIALVLAATSHPFGLAFPCAGACWYFFCLRKQGSIDQLPGRSRLGFLGTGLALGLLPTVLWFAWDPANTLRFTRALGTIYAAREPDMVAYLAGLPPWSWLSRFTPLHWAARLNALDTAAYLEYAGYPVAHYRFRHVLHGWFYVQLGVVIGFFGYSIVRRFRNATAWTHLPVWLAVGFLGCMVCYTPPNTTYNIYPSFFVSLAFVAVVWSLWCERGRLRAVGRAMTTAAYAALLATSVLYAHYATVHAVRIVRSLRTHGEPCAVSRSTVPVLRQMAARLGLERPNARVFTSTESWMAAGRDNRALLESVALGQDSDWTRVDGVVFNTVNMQFFVNSFCKDIAPPFPNPVELRRASPYRPVEAAPVRPGAQSAQPSRGIPVLHPGIFSR